MSSDTAAPEEAEADGGRPGANQTIGVRESQRFDEAALERYLAGRLEGFAPPLEVRQFAGGQSNPTFLLRTPAREYVLRKKPPGTLLKSAHMVEREFRIMQALQDTAVPVPATYLLCEDAEVIGTTFFVMEKVPGRVLRDPTLPDMAREERAALYDHFAEVLAALHTVDYRAAGLEDFGKPGNYFSRQIKRWSQQYEASKTDDIPAMENLMRWLPENIPPGDEVSLVHGDYRIENAIVHPEAPRIVAVLDWELSTLGHPLADLAYACMGYHVDLGNVESLRSADLAWSGIPSEADFIARYCALTGRTGIENWHFYLAFSLFRIAAIVQGVYKRGLDGIASNAKAVSYGQMCRLRAEQAWALVERHET